MLGNMLFLAQQSQEAGGSFWNRLAAAFDGAVLYLDILNRPDDLLELLRQVHIAVAGVLFVVGILCVLNGYRWHKWVIVVCAFLSGFGFGYLLSRTMPQPYVIAGVIALMAAVIASPLLRFSVAFFGGVTGAFVGANLWTALGYPHESLLAGAGMGFILLGMASFLMFKHVVMVFTSIGGAAMIVTGGLALLLAVPQFEETISNSVRTNQLLVPLFLIVGAVIGMVIQEGQRGHAAPKAPAATSH